VKTMMLVLLVALHSVESSNGKTSLNSLQIREICIMDVNRIYGTSYTMHDVYNKKTSEEIALLYLSYWGREYTKETKKIPSYEQYARMWNGGPDGWKKQSTLKYWKKVQKQVIIEESKLKMRGKLKHGK